MQNIKFKIFFILFMLIIINNNVYAKNNVSQIFYMLNDENEINLKNHLKCFKDNDIKVICLIDLKKFHKKRTFYILSKYQKNNNFKIAVSNDIIKKTFHKKNYYKDIKINYIYEQKNNNIKLILDEILIFNIIDIKDAIEHLKDDKNMAFLIKGSDFDEKKLIALTKSINLSNVYSDCIYEKIIINSNVLKLFNKIGLIIIKFLFLFLFIFIPIIPILKLWSYKRFQKK